MTEKDKEEGKLCTTLTKKIQLEIAEMISRSIKEFGYQAFPGQITHTDKDVLDFSMKLLWEICEKVHWGFEPKDDNLAI